MSAWDIAVICMWASSIGIAISKIGEDKGKWGVLDLITFAIAIWLYIRAGIFN